MTYSGSAVMLTKKKNIELALSKNQENDEDESAGDKDSARAINRWFMGFTSIGGLSQINASDTKVSKIFWLILFIV